MSAQHDRPDPVLEHDLRQWLRDEAPAGASRELFERVVVTATTGVQRRSWWDPLRMPVRPGPMRTATAVLASVVVPALIVGSLLSVAPAGPVVAPSPTPFVCPGSTPVRAPGAPPQASWLVGSLHEGRLSHTATELRDCRVLIMGGGTEDDEATSSVELWDAAAGSDTELAPMRTARVVHAATLLQDGRVLVIGGLERGPSGEILGPAMTAEVWDPDTMTFSDAGTAAGPFPNPSATLLADGRVLVLGGGPGRTSALVWDPATGTFEPTGSLHEGRAGGQTATLLPDGTVLVIGGFLVSVDEEGQANVTALTSVEVWDPQTGRFHEAPPLPEGRYDHTTTLLPDGRIVVVGGMVEVPGDPLRQEVSASVLVRDRVSGVFHSGGAIVAPRSGHAADLLKDGRVLVIGGSDLPAAGTAEAWDPTSGITSPLAPPSTRFSGAATHLSDGTLLLSGGWLPPISPDSEEPPPMALDLEVYDPTTP